MSLLPNHHEFADRPVTDRLPEVYEQLRALAAARLAQERPDHTLSPTALVHEAYIRLKRSKGDAPWANHAEFFAAAAEAIRRILVESARRKRAAKRGGDFERMHLDELPLIAPPLDELLDVSAALDELAREHPRHAALVKLRYFVGMTLMESAAALDISLATAKRDWEYARAWLFDAIREKNSPSE